MLSLSLAIVLAVQDTEITSGQVISKVFARYDQLSKATGSIQFVQSYGNISVTVSTKVQFEMPDKVYLYQERKSSNPGSVIVTSDGKHFSYHLPPDEPTSIGKRLVETVVQAAKTYDCRDIYAVAAGGLLDRSVPLDLLFGRRSDMALFRDQLDTIEPVQMSGENFVITGRWREYKTAIPAATYRLEVTPEFDIIRYTLRQPFQIEGMGTQDLVSDWKTDLKPGGVPEAALFRLAR